jgi:hypothetical protein
MPADSTESRHVHALARPFSAGVSACLARHTHAERRTPDGPAPSHACWISGSRLPVRPTDPLPSPANSSSPSPRSPACWAYAQCHLPPRRARAAPRGVPGGALAPLPPGGPTSTSEAVRDVDRARRGVPCPKRNGGPSCARRTNGWEYHLKLVLPNGDFFGERKKSPVSGKTGTQRYAEARAAHVSSARALPPRP